MKNKIDNIGVAAFLLLIPTLISMLWVKDDYIHEIIYKAALTLVIVLAACFIAVATFEEKEGDK